MRTQIIEELEVVAGKYLLGEHVSFAGFYKHPLFQRERYEQIGGRNPDEFAFNLKTADVSFKARKIVLIPADEEFAGQRLGLKELTSAEYNSLVQAAKTPNT